MESEGRGVEGERCGAGGAAAWWWCECCCDDDDDADGDESAGMGKRRKERKKEGRQAEEGVQQCNATQRVREGKGRWESESEGWAGASET